VPDDADQRLSRAVGVEQVVGAPRAGSERSDRMVMASDHDGGTPQRGGHSVAGCPSQARARRQQRRQETRPRAECGQRVLPRCPGLLVEQAGARRQRRLGGAVCTQPDGDVLRHVQPAHPGTDLDASRAQPQQLGKTPLRRGRQAGPRAERVEQRRRECPHLSAPRASNHAMIGAWTCRRCRAAHRTPPCP
jgi:hypothetical protein